MSNDDEWNRAFPGTVPAQQVGLMSFVLYLNVYVKRKARQEVTQD